MIKIYKYCIRFYDGNNASAVLYYNDLNTFFHDLSYDLANFKYNEISILIGEFRVGKKNNNK